MRKEHFDPVYSIILVNSHRLERSPMEMSQAQLFFAIANLIVGLFTPLIAVAACWIAYKQWINAKRQWDKAEATKRAEFIYQLLEKFRDDRDLGETFERVVNESDWLDSIFHDTKKEFKIDRLFAYLSYVCLLYRTNLILDDEINIIIYKLKTVCKNTNSQTYLWNLFHYWKQRNSLCSFQELIDYGIMNGLIDSKSFNNKDSEDYKRLLEF